MEELCGLRCIKTFERSVNMISGNRARTLFLRDQVTKCNCREFSKRHVAYLEKLEILEKNELLQKHGLSRCCCSARASPERIFFGERSNVDSKTWEILIGRLLALAEPPFSRLHQTGHRGSTFKANSIFLLNEL